MFTQHSATGYSKPLPGITQKTLVYGEKTLMVEFVLARGSNLPPHAHPYEQTGYLVKGHLRLSVAGEQTEAHAGDSWTIPMNAEHGAQALDHSVAVEVFSPVRKDYLPKTSQA